MTTTFKRIWYDQRTDTMREEEIPPEAIYTAEIRPETPWDRMLATIVKLGMTEEDMHAAREGVEVEARLLYGQRVTRSLTVGHVLNYALWLHKQKIRSFVKWRLQSLADPAPIGWDYRLHEYFSNMHKMRGFYEIAK
jgi:hypothetical protein